jgi:hypothetical protein
MAMAYVVDDPGNGVCGLCGVYARERWHIVVGCGVVDGLWGRLGATLGRLDSRGVTRRERALGLEGSGEAVRLRNRLGYTLRMAVLRARGEDYGNRERAGRLVWASFRVGLKRELVQEWWGAKLDGNTGRFNREVFVEGVLGRIDERGQVVWLGLVGEGEVGVDYWTLFR